MDIILELSNGRRKPLKAVITNKKQLFSIGQTASILNIPIAKLRYLTIKHQFPTRTKHNRRANGKHHKHRYFLARDIMKLNRYVAGCELTALELYKRLNELGLAIEIK